MCKNSVKKCDVLVFGDRYAGKKTLMEQFTFKSIQDGNSNHHMEFLKKTVTLPNTKERVQVRLWLQTNQERPFTTSLFREADCALFIADLTTDPKKTHQLLVKMNAMLDKECSADLYRALIGNKADLEE